MVNKLIHFHKSNLSFKNAIMKKLSFKEKFLMTLQLAYVILLFIFLTCFTSVFWILPVFLMAIEAAYYKKK